MMNYDYQCDVCKYLDIINKSYEDKDKHITCAICEEGSMKRAYLTAPTVRTAKLSRTFVDGTKRPGMEDLKKVADLQVEQQEVHHTSERYREIDTEIKGRNKLKQ